MHDLILTGGRVIDPSQGFDGPADIAFTDGKVSGFARDLKDAAIEIRDVSGYIVTPGLIDLSFVACPG
jgi:dihydroorotase